MQNSSKSARPAVLTGSNPALPQPLCSYRAWNHRVQNHRVQYHRVLGTVKGIFTVVKQNKPTLPTGYSPRRCHLELWPGETQGLVSKVLLTAAKTTFVGCFSVPAALPLAPKPRCAGGFATAPQRVPGPVQKMHEELRFHAGTSC